MAKAQTKPAPASKPVLKKTAVAVRAATNVAERKAPGRGFEEADKDSFAIPFLVIVQDKAKIMDQFDCQPGDIVNTATGKVYESVDVVPVLYRRRFVKWGANRGGFKGELTPSQVNEMVAAGDLKAAEDSQDFFFPLPDGTVNEKKCDYVKDTRSHFVLVDGKPALIALASSQIKKSKNWMSSMQEAGGDMFDHMWTLSTVEQSNDQGDWHGWKIEPSEEEVTDDIKQLAEELYASITGGKVTVDHGAAEGTE